MRILFVGGGTLGSVTPLLAVVEELRSRSGGLQASTHGDLKVAATFWGTRRGPERALVEAAGIPFRTMPSGKLRRYWDVRNILDLAVVKWAFWVALVRLIRWWPSVVVGAGSFVQVPVMWAAWVLRIPIVIHQLDVRPSLANRLVAPFAQHITAVVPVRVHAFGRHPVEVIGNPMRTSILAARDLEARAAKRHFGFSGDRPVLLVIGGGTGAQALNELVWASLLKFLEHADVLHVVGPGKNVPTPPRPPSQREVGEQKNISPLPIGRGSDLSREAQRAKWERGRGDHYRSFDLLTDDLPYAYAAANLVISRAGMGTITELGCLGKAMVLVPMPGTHQEENAAAVADAGAAVVWDQRALTLDAFARQVAELLRDHARLLALGRAGAVLFPVSAAHRVAGVLLRLGGEIRR